MNHYGLIPHVFIPEIVVKRELNKENGIFLSGCFFLVKRFYKNSMLSIYLPYQNIFNGNNKQAKDMIITFEHLKKLPDGATCLIPG